jgi:hypothetical protein
MGQGQGRMKGILAIGLTLIGLIAPAGASAASASVEATVNLGGLLPLPLPPLPAGSCTLCANFVTTSDADGTNGPVAPFTRMHRDIVSNVPYALDVDGSLPPVPLGILPLPGYELRATVEALSADRPTVTLAKLATALPTLPLRAEIVTGDVSDPAAPKTTFGYDTLDATAPQSFKAALDLTDRDSNAATTNAFADLTIDTTARRLTVVTEGFTGAPDGDRTERNIRRLTYRGDPDKGTVVPKRASIDVAAATTSQRVILTRDLRTTLDVEVIEAVLGRRLTATLDELPTRADLTIEDTDVNADGSTDKKATYLATAAVKNATLRLEDGGAVSRAAVTDLPSDVKLTYASLANGTPAITTDDGTAVTYKSNGRATHAELRREDGPRVLNASVDNLPANINDLRYLPSLEGGHVVYNSDGSADGGTVEVSDGPKTTKAVLVKVPGTMDITWSSTSAAGNAHYIANGPARKADLEFVDPQGQRTTVGLDSEPNPNPSLPTDVNVDYSKSRGKLDFKYTANAEVPSAAIHGTGLKGLPGKAKDLHLVLKDVPTVVGFNLASSDESTVVQNEVDPPELCQHISEEELPNHPECPGHEDYVPPKETITTRIQDLDLSVSTPAPSGVLGSGEIQMTSGPDDRLPLTAENGNALDGVKLHELKDSYVLFARVSKFDQLTLKRNKITRQRRGPGFPRDTGHETLDASLDTAADNHALGVDIKKETSTGVVEGKDALLASLPSHIELHTAHHDTGITVTDTTDWSATRTVDGYGIAPDRRPGFKYVESVSHNGTTGIAKQLTLDPMPMTLRACQLDFGVACADHTFDENITKLRTGDYEPSVNPPPPTYRCFGNGCAGGKEIPIPHDVAYKGSVLLEAIPPATMSYLAPGTTVNFGILSRFVLQAHQDSEGCLADTWTCKMGYIAIDSGGQELVGSVQTDTADFHFPPAFSATQHVWGFHETGPKQGEVATIGPRNCPEGTKISAGGDEHTTKWCDGHLTEWSSINF